MAKAYVNGVECVVYYYRIVDGLQICLVKYPHVNVLTPVLAELIEVTYEV